jgi:hypothetical protein
MSSNYLYVYPMIIPQKIYTDKFKAINSYYNMNPSMNIDSDGNIIILIRRVNYKKYYNKKSIVYENPSKSIYSILRGYISDNKPLDIDSFNIDNIEYKYEIPTYPTYWKGLEDIRFVSSNSILVTIPECNSKGNPSIFHAKLNDNKIHSFINCYPNTIEKNWMPYNHTNGNEYVIYSLSPFKIKHVQDEVFETIKLDEDISKTLDGFHGSTNGVEYTSPECKLFLIHINGEKTYHRWLLFNLNTCQVKLSDSFYFFKHSYIEFPVSLCKFNDRIFISLGVNDDTAFIIETDMTKINDSFIIN